MYRYRQTGKQTVAGATSHLDPTGSLVVEPADRNGKQVSHLRVDHQQPPSDQTLRFNRHGVFLLSEVQRYTFAGHTQTIRCTFHPGLPYPPWPLSVGTTFKGGGDCGSVQVSGKGRVVAKRHATVGGKRFVVFVIDSTLHTSGSVTSTTHDTQWFSPALRLPVKDAGSTRGSFGPFGFTSDFTRTLAAPRPR